MIEIKIFNKDDRLGVDANFDIVGTRHEAMGEFIAVLNILRKADEKLYTKAVSTEFAKFDAGFKEFIGGADDE